MADKYGYMAKIGVDTSGVQAGLKEADTALNAYDRSLRQVQKSIENADKAGIDSSEAQKNKYDILTQQLEVLKRKYRELDSVQQSVNNAFDKKDIGTKEFTDFNVALTETRAKIKAVTDALNETESASKDAGKASENFAKSASQIDKVDYSNITNSLKSIEKVALVSGAAISAMLGKISSDALSAYSQYEQLVGGIETLFAGAEDIVLANAQNAFKTAGISANNYMQTVTSFSATLLQGLEGDTKKAAELADLALIDMSDNANKMGTAMASIQYAYQGFAKQNYTMLDNLKLGYGGSQAEMARLINDSGVLNGEIVATARNVKEIPFDKIIEAIHVIQTNLKITGTTAKEAETTLEGSMNKLKASWENALVEIARPLDDFAQNGLTLLNDNVDEIKDALVNMMKESKPLLDDVIEKLKDWIDSGGIEKATTGFVDAVRFVIDNKETLLGLFAALEVSLGAERFGKASSGIMELTKNINSLGSVINAATGASEAMSISLSGWIGIAALAITAGMAVKESIENARDALSQHSETVNDLEDEYAELNKTLETFNELKKESIELAGKEANAHLDEAQKQAQIYKNKIDNYEKLLQKNREYYKTDNLNGKELFYFDNSGNAAGSAGYFSDISDELGSLYQNYYAATEIVKAYGEAMEETASENIRHMGEAEEAAKNSVKNIGRNTSDVIAEIKDRKFTEAENTLQSKINDIEHKLKGNTITEDDYYKSLRNILDNEKEWLEDDSELWHSYDGKYRSYIDKINKEKKDAADQAAKDAQEEADKKRKEIEDRAKEELKAWTDSADDISKAIEDKYKQVTKNFESAKGEYVKALDLSHEVQLANGSNKLVLDDLTEQTKTLQKYRKDMAKLQETGISTEHLANIQSMSYDDRAAYVDALLGMTDANRQRYYRDYEAYLKEAALTAQQDVQDELKEANNAAVNGLDGILGSIPESAYEKGKETAISYLKGFEEYMNGANTSVLSPYISEVYRKSEVTAAQSYNAASSFMQSTGDFVINVAGQEVLRMSMTQLMEEYKNSGGIIGA